MEFIDLEWFSIGKVSRVCTEWRDNRADISPCGASGVPGPFKSHGLDVGINSLEIFTFASS